MAREVQTAINVEAPEQQTGQAQEEVVASWKKNIVVFKVLGLILAFLVTLGWIGIIVVLIMEEEWQLVLVAWLLLYAAAHFCYWYCRRNSVHTLHNQIRERLNARMRGTESAPQCEGDCPPSYEDLVKSETPPPAYYSVVSEKPKSKRMLNIHSLPLPWFIKKKALEQAESVSVSPSDVGKADGSEGMPSTSQQESSARKSCGNVDMYNLYTIQLDNGEEETFELPSYEQLMKETAIQPVLTPIHQALTNLPSIGFPGPPSYNINPMEAIVEVEQQQNEEESQSGNTNSPTIRY